MLMMVALKKRELAPVNDVEVYRSTLEVTLRTGRCSREQHAVALCNARVYSFTPHPSLQFKPMTTAFLSAFPSNSRLPESFSSAPVNKSHMYRVLNLSAELKSISYTLRTFCSLVFLRR
jgi:hypothetical protein